MRIVVLGAGIAGIVTAWFLAAGGAEVTVIDRGMEPASETSHANGGHISTQSGTPWTGPAGVREFVTTRLSRAPSVRIFRAREPARRRWFALALAASRPARYRRACAVIARLARFSREVFETLVAEQEMDVALEADGVFALYRSGRIFARAARRKPEGVEAWSAADVLAREPALAAAAIRPAGALYYPGDATGDCRAFCVALGERAAAGGVEFRYGVSARELIVEHGRCRGVVTDAGELRADGCVAALGAWSANFLRPYGIRLPVIALRGYTLTAPIANDAPAPGRFNDVERHIVGARLGGCFRAAGMADFSGLDTLAPPARITQFEQVVREWYPALSRTRVEYWSCLRPITPDGPPILGESAVAGLWLNTGCGPLGWTLGCGAGKIVAEIVLGRAPPVPLAGLTLERF